MCIVWVGGGVVEHSQSRVMDLFQKNCQQTGADMPNVQFEVEDLFYVMGLFLNYFINIFKVSFNKLF